MPALPHVPFQLPLKGVSLMTSIFQSHVYPTTQHNGFYPCCTITALTKAANDLIQYSLMENFQSSVSWKHCCVVIDHSCSKVHLF